MTPQEARSAVKKQVAATAHSSADGGGASASTSADPKLRQAERGAQQTAAAEPGTAAGQPSEEHDGAAGKRDNGGGSEGEAAGDAGSGGGAGGASADAGTPVCREGLLVQRMMQPSGILLVRDRAACGHRHYSSSGRTLLDDSSQVARGSLSYVFI